MSEAGDSDSRSQTPRRLDVELVRRGLFDSRSQAQAAIAAGKVFVDGAQAAKPGQMASAASRIDAEAAHPWVSRGGVKLARALDVFGVDPAGLVCLDVGASTGGFTDVLLARGARRVVAVDVGRGQLHPRIAGDARVLALEATDARSLTHDLIGEAPDLVVCDASFIGLAKVLQVPLSLASADARLVALFKPQFEVGPENIGRGGHVTGEAAVESAAAALAAWLEASGWAVGGWAPSPIAGGDGAVERLLWACREGR